MGISLWTVLFQLSLPVLVQLAAGQYCPQKCQCSHRIGRLTTDCTNANLTGLPQPIPERSMVLILNQNNFSHLDERVSFETIKATHITELQMVQCRISNVTVMEKIWKGLIKLGKLVISHNRIQKLKKDVFVHFHGLKTLDLKYNDLVSLEAGWFGPPYLEELDLSHNKINFIFNNAFSGLINLKRIYLQYNHLTKVFPEAFRHLPSLQILNLKGNSWHCDCYLRAFVKWERGKYKTEPPQCAGPQRVAEKFWNNLELNDFACGPKAEPKFNQPIYADPGTDVTFQCNIESDPDPSVSWEFKSYIKKALSNPSIGNRRRMSLKTVPLSKDQHFQSVLSITNIDPNDTGEYHCQATIPIGSDYTVFTLHVRNFSASSHMGAADNVEPKGSSSDARSAVKRQPSQTPVLSGLTHDWVIVISIIITVVLLILLSIIIVVCYRRRQGAARRRSISSSFYTHMNGNGYKYLADNGGHHDKRSNQINDISCDHGFTPLFESSKVHVAAVEKQIAELQRREKHKNLAPYQETTYIPPAGDRNHASHVPVEVAQDDSGYLDAIEIHSQTSSSRYATLPPPTNYKRNQSPQHSNQSSPNTCAADKRRHSLPSSKNPLVNSHELAHHTEANGGFPLRETAL